jgi:hypothetical protein
MTTSFRLCTEIDILLDLDKNSVCQKLRLIVKVKAKHKKLIIIKKYDKNSTLSFSDNDNGLKNDRNNKSF